MDNYLLIKDRNAYRDSSYSILHLYDLMTRTWVFFDIYLLIEDKVTLRDKNYNVLPYILGTITWMNFREIRCTLFYIMSV